MGEMSILGRRGDTKVIWNPANKHEVKSAERQFKDHVLAQKLLLESEGGEAEFLQMANVL